MNAAPSADAAVSLRSTILLGGTTATGNRVAARLVAALASSKRPAVRAKDAGYGYRSAIAPLRGANAVSTLRGGH